MDIVKRYTYLDFNTSRCIPVEKTNIEQQAEIG